MAAETLNCPMCGAAASSDSPQCEHCGARLATVACPSCFGMMFVGAKFCSHCGAKADRTEVAATHELCPRCHVEMEAVLIGKTHLEECPHCEGIWADADSLQQICADREQQSAVLGMATSTPAPEANNIEEHIHYIPCPVCKNLMNRVNFAHCSQVIVNVCSQHGTWFDKDQLRRIVEFIRAGGIEKERAKEIKELEERQRQIKTPPVGDIWTACNPPTMWNDDPRHLGISAVADLITAFLDR